MPPVFDHLAQLPLTKTARQRNREMGKDKRLTRESNRSEAEKQSRSRVSQIDSVGNTLALLGPRT
jgi:hypothetical protein